jgi:hypothetical protein
MAYKYPSTKFTDYDFYLSGIPIGALMQPEETDLKEVQEAWEEVFKRGVNKETLKGKNVGLVLNRIFLDIEESRQSQKEYEQKQIYSDKDKSKEIKELKEKIKQLQEEVKNAKQFQLKF